MGGQSAQIAGQLVGLSLQHQRSFQGQLLVWFRLHHSAGRFGALLQWQSCCRIEAAYLVRAARTNMARLVGRPVRYGEIARRDRRQRCLLPGAN